MFKDSENRWTRERSFWERHGGEIGILLVCVGFLGLTVAAVSLLLFKPEIPGLSNIFKAPPPPPPPTKPSVDQKFHYSVPGESEVLIIPGKPVRLPPPPPEKPPAPPRKP